MANHVPRDHTTQTFLPGIICLYCFLISSSEALETVYEALFTGVADIGTHRFTGDLYWVSADGESKAYAYYGLKYGNSKRFEVATSSFNQLID
jgi:hypothetical protein